MLRAKHQVRYVFSSISLLFLPCLIAKIGVLCLISYTMSDLNSVFFFFNLSCRAGLGTSPHGYRATAARDQAHSAALWPAQKRRLHRPSAQQGSAAARHRHQVLIGMFLGLLVCLLCLSAGSGLRTAPC